MTVVLSAFAAVVVGLTVLAFTGSGVLALAGGLLATFVWMYLPLPLTNGSMGGTTDRHWGFTE